MTPDAVRGCTVLLVDDEEANLDLLEAFLRSDGYTSLVRTSDARRAVPLLEEHGADLVLLDLHMPHLSGFQVLEQVRARTAPGEYLPVLVLTADATADAKERALSGGANDFLIKPLFGTEVLLRVRNLLETRVLHRQERAARAAAEAAAARAALLAEASRVLGASLDSDTALAQLARLVVPRLADACVVELAEGGRFVPAAAAHADPEREAALRAALAPADAATHPLAELFREERATQLAWALEYGAGSGPSLGPGATVAAPFRSAGGIAGGVVLVRAGEGRRFAREELELAEELARRVALAAENARLFAHAQQATRARDHTLAVVAHDLRNPLASIAMGSEMLLHMLPPKATAFHKESLESMYQSAHRMHRLVDDLLDVARMDMGGLTLDAGEREVGALFADAESMLRPLAEARSVRLELAGCDDAPPVLADGPRVVQVLSNLVGNALKFSPEGSRVRVSCAAAGPELRVSVADQGPGIPAEQLPHLFGAFWQADRRDRRGVGLGLSIARAVVEAHGGRIWVDTRVGEGSTFHFTLPLAAPPAAADEAPVAEETPAA
ncbi:MAG TPA: ATP-binding protein [Longimicrobiaceae bacterium]|jgi:signal transduction histidine kinase